MGSISVLDIENVEDVYNEIARFWGFSDTQKDYLKSGPIDIRCINLRMCELLCEEQKFYTPTCSVYRALASESEVDLDKISKDSGVGYPFITKIAKQDFLMSPFFMDLYVRNPVTFKPEYLYGISQCSSISVCRQLLNALELNLMPFDCCESLVRALNNNVPYDQVVGINDKYKIQVVERAWLRGVALGKYVSDFGYTELDAIADFLADGYDPAPVIGRGLSGSQMSVILMAMKSSMNFGWYLNPSYSFNKMFELYQLQRLGVDIAPYCNDQTTAKDLRDLRISMESDKNGN